jgi:hypothetical protein
MRLFGSAIRLPGAPPVSSSDHRHAVANGLHVRLDELHRVVDRHAGIHGPAGRVDVEEDVLVAVVRLQVQELGHDEVGDRVVHRLAEEHDPLVEQPREDVERTLSAGGRLYDHRDQCHLKPSSSKKGPAEVWRD